MLSLDWFQQLEHVQKTAYLLGIYEQLNADGIFDDVLMILQANTPLSEKRLEDMYASLLQLKSANAHILLEASQEYAKTNTQKQLQERQADEQQAEHLLQEC